MEQALKCRFKNRTDPLILSQIFVRYKILRHVTLYVEVLFSAQAVCSVKDPARPGSVICENALQPADPAATG